MERITYFRNFLLLLFTFYIKETSGEAMLFLKTLEYPPTCNDLSQQVLYLIYELPISDPNRLKLHGMQRRVKIFLLKQQFHRLMIVHRLHQRCHFLLLISYVKFGNARYRNLYLSQLNNSTLKSPASVLVLFLKRQLYTYTTLM